MFGVVASEVTIMFDGALLPWGFLNTCLPTGGSLLIPHEKPKTLDISGQFPIQVLTRPSPDLVSEMRQD